MPGRSGDPNLLVGTETSDDAGVYRLSGTLALVQTLDFFPPLVDDPFTYGQIAAANALSDVYAMNGNPITAMNIAAFPDDELDLSILSEILRGAADRVTAAGAVTVGGHTVRDSGIKFGLSVTGLVNPVELLTNAGAMAGDVLVLTKPLGTGFVTTANKKEECPQEVLAQAIESMIQLNGVGRDALIATGGTHALTDVTGFGLGGHASEMAEGANLTVVLDVARFPLIEGARALGIPRYFTRASKSNREFLAGRLLVEPTADRDLTEFAFDPQTSGGLLIAIDPIHVSRLLEELKHRGAKASAVVGQVVDRMENIAVILR